MMQKTVVVTGARSYLGSAFIAHLAGMSAAGTSPWRVYGLASPRPAEAGAPPGAAMLTADLTRPLPRDAAERIAAAGAVIHFAWLRDKSFDRAVAGNLLMLHHVMAAMPDASRLVFISSVAAAPSAQSVYGRAKFALTEAVAERGGVSAACGLVIDEPPRGPYALLTKVVQAVPVRLRFTGGGPKVYPIARSVMCARLAAAIEQANAPGAYGLWQPPILLNALLQRIEEKQPRSRLPLTLPTGPVQGAAAGAARLPQPVAGLADKVLTLLHKDDAYLASLPQLAGARS